MNERPYDYDVTTFGPDRAAEGCGGTISCTEASNISRRAASLLLGFAEALAEGLEVDHADLVAIAEDLDQLADDMLTKRQVTSSIAYRLRDCLRQGARS